MMRTQGTGNPGWGWRKPFCLMFLLLQCSPVGIGLGQSESATGGNRDAQGISVDSTPAATVDGYTITRNQVLRELRNANAGEQDLPPQVIALGLRHLVRKQVVLARLQTGPVAMGPSETKMEIGKIQARLAETGSSLEKHLADSGATLEEFRNELQWRTVWQRHLDENIRDETVAAWFEKHHKRFDGTLVNVDQVLWLFAGDEPPDQRQRMHEQANAVWQQLKSGDTGWDDAVRDHSMSPLAQQPDGRSDRWIGWRGPMPRAFTDAAFGLKPGEFSGPVETAIGLHIIRCIEIRPGDRKAGEVDHEVRAAMAEEIFESIADQASPDFPASYSGRVPWLDAAGKLVLPDQPGGKPDNRRRP